MTVTGDRVPTAQTLLGIIDTQAQAAMGRARDGLAPIIAREVPRRRGRTAAALRPRVSKTATGAAMTVAAPRGKAHDRYATIADVVRWVNQGTGVRRSGAGAKRPIRPKSRRRGAALNVYGRRYRSVRGQRANPFMDRIKRAGDPRVERALRDGAVVAARAVERRIG